jgi:hypothetical protein
MEMARAFDLPSAGRSRLARIPMMTMTTRSSMSVNAGNEPPGFLLGRCVMLLSGGNIRV